MKNIKSSYKNYKEKSSNPVSLQEYCKIVNNWNKFLMANILNGEEVRLPSKMGTLSIRGKKTKLRYNEQGQIKGYAPDYQATKKLWDTCPECKEKKQLVYYLNEHTNGVRYKFLWKKDKVFLSFKLFYTFIFTRTNKRTLSKLIQEGKEYYIEPNKY